MTRYVAVTRGFRYPVGAHASLAVGRVSKMTDDERASVEWKVVGIGDDCSDMPAESLARYLERGDVAIVATDPAPPKAKKGRG